MHSFDKSLAMAFHWIYTIQLALPWLFSAMLWNTVHVLVILVMYVLSYISDLKVSKILYLLFFYAFCPLYVCFPSLCHDVHFFKFFKKWHIKSMTTS